MPDVTHSRGQERRGFHIEKTVSYSDVIHMLATTMAIVSVLVITDRRIEQNASEIRKIAAVQMENDRRQDDLRTRIEYSLGDISKKMDWIVSQMVERKLRD